MIERVLRTIAIALSLIVAAGFCLFAFDEFDRASSAQRDRLQGYEQSPPTAVGERQREKRNTSAREYIDDANDLLLKPFAGVADSRQPLGAARRADGARAADLRLPARVPRALRTRPRLARRAPARFACSPRARLTPVALPAAGGHLGRGP